MPSPRGASQRTVWVITVDGASSPLRCSSNDTPVGFCGSPADVGSRLGMGLRGASVVAGLVPAVAVGLAVTATASEADGTGVGVEELAPHAARTAASITASAARPQAIVVPPA